MAVDRADHDGGTCGDEQRGGPGMTWHQISNTLPRVLFGVRSPPKHEQRRSRKPEENEIGRDHIVENLLIALRQRDYYRQNALQSDRHHRRLGALGYESYAAKKEPIFGHGEIDSRRGEHSLAQESERRQRDDNSC